MTATGFAVGAVLGAALFLAGWRLYLWRESRKYRAFYEWIHSDEFEEWFANPFNPETGKREPLEVGRITTATIASGVITAGTIHSDSGEEKRNH